MSQRPDAVMPARPRGMSRRSLLAGAGAAAALLATPGRALAAGGDTSKAIIDAINEQRRARGIHDLLPEHRLAVVADTWSAKMLEQRRLSHNSNRQAEYGWASSGMGEVVAMTGGTDRTANARRVVELWMGSTAHRDLILSARYTHAGAGWAADGAGRFYATVDLIATDLPAVGQEAVGLSRALVGDGQASRAVIVRDDVAADALAASALLEGDVPLLLTPPDRALAGAVIAELDRVLRPGATVHLVGGGLSADVEQRVREIGATPVRLRGASRYETAAVVAREVREIRGEPWRHLLVDGDGWADAAAAGAFAARFGTPVLLTPRNSLHPATRQVLRDTPSAENVVVGGTGVISDDVARAADAWRVSGRDRAETSGRIMLDMWGAEAGEGGGLIVSPGWTGDGWGIALAHASFAARDGHPLLFSGPGLPGPVGDAIRQVGFGSSRPAALRFARHVTDRARQEFTAVAS